MNMKQLRSESIQFRNEFKTVVVKWTTGCRVAVGRKFSFPFPSNSHRIPTCGNDDFPQVSQPVSTQQAQWGNKLTKLGQHSRVIG